MRKKELRFAIPLRSNILFSTNNNHIFGENTHGCNNKIWFLKSIAINKAALKATYLNIKYVAEVFPEDGKTKIRNAFA